MTSAPSSKDRTYPYFQDRTFRQVVHPDHDPQIGNLATPINSSKLAKSFLQNLPAYRAGLKPFRRALEVGIFNGLFIVIPFVKLGPLRDTDAHLTSGILSALGLIAISAASISLYAISNPPPPLDHVAAKRPDSLVSKKDWNEYASGFLVGGVVGTGIVGALLWLLEAV